MNNSAHNDLIAIESAQEENEPFNQISDFLSLRRRHVITERDFNHLIDKAVNNRCSRETQKYINREA